MKKFIKNNRIYILGAVMGAIGGFFYWKEIGCSSGTCIITSSPVRSTMYFALMGSLFFGIFKKEKHV